MNRPTLFVATAVGPTHQLPVKCIVSDQAK